METEKLVIDFVFAVNGVLVEEISLAPPFIAHKTSRDAVETWNFFKFS